MSELDPIVDAVKKHGPRVGQYFLKFAIALMRPLSTTTEVLVRRSMGERYFTAWNLYAGGGLIYLFIVVPFGLTTLAGKLTGRNTSPNLLAFLVGLVWLGVFMIRALMHFSAVHERYRIGVTIHSYYIGDSIFRRLEKPEYLTAVPFFILGALLCLCGTWALGALMMASALLTVLSRLTERAILHARMLDAIDAHIEQTHFAAAVMQRLKPNKTEGYRAPLPAYVSNKHRSRFVQAETGHVPDLAPHKDTPSKFWIKTQAVISGLWSVCGGFGHTLVEEIRRNLPQDARTSPSNGDGQGDQTGAASPRVDGPRGPAISFGTSLNETPQPASASRPQGCEKV